MKAFLVVVGIGIVGSGILGIFIGLKVAIALGILFIFAIGGPILWGWADKDYE